MHLDALIEAAGARDHRDRVRSLVDRLDPSAPRDWRNLAGLLGAADRGAVVGISGGQGAGKSTLARLLARAVELNGGTAVACSLDDFYLSHDARQRLAATVHPLLATRGVPGTHDVALALATLDGLTRRGTTRVPGFDKGRDDVCPEDQWRAIVGPVSRVIFEGWCLGAPAEPQSRLETPRNELEAREDADGVWRRYVNQALAGAYGPLWARLDYLVYLQVPDMAAVARWRAEQEAQLPVAQRMSAAALKRFICHYERLTRWMAETLPARADLVVKLDADHTISALRAR